MSHPTIIDTAMEHPQISGFISLGSLLFSILLKFADKLYTWHWPPFVMETLQVLAWVVAIGAGTITIYSFFKKRFSKKDP